MLNINILLQKLQEPLLHIVLYVTLPLNLFATQAKAVNELITHGRYRPWCKIFGNQWLTLPFIHRYEVHKVFMCCNLAGCEAEYKSHHSLFRKVKRLIHLDTPILNTLRRETSLAEQGEGEEPYAGVGREIWRVSNGLLYKGQIIKISNFTNFCNLNRHRHDKLKCSTGWSSILESKESQDSEAASNTKEYMEE